MRGTGRGWAGAELGAAALGLALTTGAGAARAQSQSEIVLAQKAFDEGAAAERSGDFATACQKFEQALALKPTPEIQLRIGNCQEKQGLLVEAVASFRRALERAQQANRPLTVAAATKLLQNLEPRIPSIRVELDKPYEGVVVTLDGTELASAALGSPLPVNPGKHELVANAPEHFPFEQGFGLAESDSRRFVVALTERPRAPPPPPPPPPKAAPPPPPPDPPIPWAPIGLVGGGAVAVGFGVGFLVAGAGANADVDDLCGDDRLACPISRKDGIEAEVSRAHALTGVGAGLTGLGVVAAGVGTAWLLGVLDPWIEPRKTGFVTVAPTGGPGAGGVVAAGRF